MILVIPVGQIDGGESSTPSADTQVSGSIDELSFTGSLKVAF